MTNTMHICNLPMWEREVYWDTIFYISKHKMIYLCELPKKLQKYNKEDIKQVLEYEEKEFHSVLRLTRNTWQWKD